MIIKQKKSNHFLPEKPYIKLGEGINGQKALGENLDITNNATITRAGISTVVNKDGYLQNIPANYPRFDYDPITHKFKGILIEHDAQNKFINSNTLGSPTTIETNINHINTITPYGIQDKVCQLTETNVTASHYIRWSTGSTVLANSWHTISVFAKKRSDNDRHIFRIHINAGNKADYQEFILSNANSAKAIGAHTTNIWEWGNAKIEEYGNDWYRCSVTFKVPVVLTYAYLFLLIDSTGNASYTGTPTAGMYFFGMQIEKNSNAFIDNNTTSSSYIPTGSSAVTRNRDILKLNLNKFVDR